MSDKPIKIPSPEHPITITPNSERVVVSVGGRVIADTRRALTLQEADYPAVQYIPLSDVDTSMLVPTDHSTYCPYKGECSYYSIIDGGERTVNAVWVYNTPYAYVAQIKDHIAFYPNRVDSITEQTS